jgi:hypothetical protein
MGCLPRNEAHSALHCRKALLLGYIWCPDKAARDEHVNINLADFLYLCNRPFLHCHLVKRTKLIENVIWLEFGKKKRLQLSMKLSTGGIPLSSISGDIICSVTRREYFHCGIS